MVAYIPLIVLALTILIALASADSYANDASIEENANTPTDDFFISRNSLSAMCTLSDHRISIGAESLSGQDLVNYVNRHQNLWTAKLNKRFNSYDESVKSHMMGVRNIYHSIRAKKMLGKTRFLDIMLPDAFDARENWPNCPSIRAIRDQSSCGSCWALGAVEAMSDRVCISSGGNIQVTLSADDLLSCCKACGFGCEGGELLEAWEFWVRDGIVTGSNYTLHQGCRPYPFPPCEHHSTKQHFEPCKHDLYPTPRCEKKCQASYTDKAYAEDKYYGRNAYAVDTNVKAIQNELYTNGPFEVAFEVYEDFLNYKSGIYKHVGGKMAGGHAVKLIGWGVEDGVDYWLVANSWNRDFGEDGFFRIVRGRNECGIESGGVAGIPRLQNFGGGSDDSTSPLLQAHHHHHRQYNSD